MQVKDAMTKDVELASPTQTIRQAALLMGKTDCGALPVADKDSLVGMITDRDIAIRAVAAGKGPKTLVRDIMSAEVLYCFEDQELDEVARQPLRQEGAAPAGDEPREAPRRHPVARRHGTKGERHRSGRRRAEGDFRARRRAFAEHGALRAAGLSAFPSSRACGERVGCRTQRRARGGIKRSHRRRDALARHSPPAPAACRPAASARRK